MAPLPGTTGTPLARMRSRAGTFSPMAAIASGGGPTKTIPESAHARANAAFSLRKPYPGWIAWAPVRCAASITRSIRRYDCADGAGPISTASSASSVNAALRSASLCTATVRMPRSRQPRMTRIAISPRLATSTVSNTACLLDVDQRIAGADDVALLHVDPCHAPAAGRGDVVLHLHRLEHGHDIAEVHRVAHGDRDLEQQALHGSHHGPLADDRRGGGGLGGGARRGDGATDDAHGVRLPVDLDGQLAHRGGRR